MGIVPAVRPRNKPQELKKKSPNSLRQIANVNVGRRHPHCQRNYWREQFVERFIASGPYPEPLKACLDCQTFAPYF